MMTILVEPHRVDIIGHANYDEPGKDIVCSAISSLFCTLCMAFDESEKEEHMESGYGSLKVMASERADILLEAFVNGFKAIAEQYPQNVVVVC